MSTTKTIIKNPSCKVSNHSPNHYPLLVNQIAYTDPPNITLTFPLAFNSSQVEQPTQIHQSIPTQIEHAIINKSSYLTNTRPMITHTKNDIHKSYHKSYCQTYSISWPWTYNYDPNSKDWNNVGSCLSMMLLCGMRHESLLWINPKI